jgi:two-component system sensor histidine kinase TctE
MTIPKNRSLKTTILFRLAIPLIVFIAIETLFTYLVTTYYVDEAYDRWLLDSAYSLKQEIRIKENAVEIDLPPSALEIFQWNETDNTFFKVSTQDGVILAGDNALPTLTPPLDQNPFFSITTINDQPVRMVTIRLQDSFYQDILIQVAETMHKRQGMMRDILIADLLPQIILSILVIAYLFRGIEAGLSPLQRLAKEIAKRTPNDLSPIPENQVFEEVRSLINTINHLLAKLADVINSQQSFISNAAHQLKTPLAGLKLQAERAMQESSIEAMQPALKQIRNSADRTSHTIVQLLSLAKASSFENRASFTAINLDKLTRKICLDWAPKALQKNIDLSFHADFSEVQINGDEILLTEMLSNLIDNAIVYGHPNGKVAVSIHHATTPELIIEDDGPGIPAQEIERIFDRFYRIPGSEGDGCGLGLAIVQEIADLHQIQLIVSCPETGGTRFVIQF